MADKAKTPQERANEKREAKLAQIQEQIADGSLTVRKMTPAERREQPPRPRTRKQSR